MQHDQPRFSRGPQAGDRSEDFERRSGSHGGAQEYDERDWNERYQRGGRSAGPSAEDMRYRGRGRGEEPGYGRREGPGGPGYHGDQGEQMGPMGQGQSGGWAEGFYGYGHPSYYEQMGHGQRGRRMGQGMEQPMGNRDFERDWEDYGRIGGHGRSAEGGWTSRPGYGGGFFEEEQGRGQRGRQSGRGEFRGQGPKGYTRSDERIQEEVCELLADADVDVSDVTVRVREGEITLEGSVDSRYAKREIEDIACEARGVKDCQNQLRVMAGSEEESAETGRSRRGRQEIGSRTGEGNPSMS